MRRRGRSLFGVLLFGAGAIGLYVWRRRARDVARAFLTECRSVTEFVKRKLGQQGSGSNLSQVTSDADDNSPKAVVTGLEPPECRPLDTPAELLAWSPALDPDAPFCQTYNSPLLLPPPLPAATAATAAAVLPAPSSPALAPTAAAAAAAAAAGPGSQRPPAGPSTRTAAAPAAAVPSVPAVAAVASAAAAVPAPTAAVAAAGPAAVGGAARSPRLLVCHDMMGGYLDDRLTQGSSDPGFFRLWQWDQVDLFVYFSHHMVTLPPPSWTAAAHRNGVRVLHADWSGAVWVGEAPLAAFRLVQLEVPGWARSVTLLAQPLGAEAAELQHMQPLACVAVPSA
ncbi:Cytosolic endo-beta-N-acetylglucosaminidase [Tetrabaena socialis]|uniref:Cytosolic endo-beta-N-acetylglucosaminidase n=1 Tax=Tetrabaena socialis TaxID=47790 RepID=A0A2J8A2A5_9CHLO|nr:Cytosolic endo-beta-N-acetylglucosaminidase [Tetrabaena socialis]|eukprot:PNH06647.1 Cytosolic endo-beta-N-acetylglucosaminidase [Tetrabaena socialis]